MNCKKYLKFIDDFADGELDGQNSEPINRHISDCSVCADYYEMLLRESNLYANYLLEVEVPKDLFAKFQTKLEAEKSFDEKKSFALFFKRTTSAFRSLNLAYSGASAVILLLVVFGFWQFFDNAPNRDFSANELGKTIETNKTESFAKNEKENNVEFPPPSKTAESKISLKNNIKPPSKTAISDAKVSAVKKKEQVDKNQKKISQDNEFVKEEQQFADLQTSNLEKETAKQIEKIELLLRSFRNARLVENGETFDVGYEQKQAKKLLEKNVLLRRQAESSGTFQTEEILSQVEPYLLDISNLENNPPQEKVLDIKNRVKNRNIIANLQVY